MFEPNYPTALARLNAFVPQAGRDYASKRNYDDMAHVSALSPYIRHRLITEEDVEQKRGYAALLSSLYLKPRQVW